MNYFKIAAFFIIVSCFSACALRGDNSDNNNNSNNNNNSSNNNNDPVGWTLVGDANISGGAAQGPIIRFYDHVPYVAFLDDPSGSRTVRVMKYNSSSGTWEDVGTDFSAGSDHLAFEIDSSSGTLYVAYSDGTQSGKLTVRKFSGGVWSNVGSVGFSTGAVEWVALALKGGTTPYVAYYDTDVGQNRIKVQKYSGAWNILSDASIVPGDNISITADSTNVYLAYRIISTNKLSLKKYNATDTLSSIASPNADQINYTSVFIEGNSLYLTYIDLDDSNKAVAKVYDTVGTAWSSIGSVDSVLSDDAAAAPYIYVNNSSTPHDVIYVAYQDIYSSSKASVKTCLNDPSSTWSALGGLGLSSTSITTISIYLDNAHPYVAYINATSDGIEVKKY